MKTISRKKEIFILLGIFFSAILLRVGYWFFLKENYFFYGHPGGDVLYYSLWAKEIAYENWIGKTTFYGMPLYPYVLAMIDRISLGHIEIIRFFHIFLGSLNCLLVYKVAKKMFSVPAAILSGFLCSFSFILVYYDWLMMPVTLIIFLTLCITLVLMSFPYLRESKHLWGTGLLLGIAILSDGKFLIFSFMSIIYLLIVAKMLKDKTLAKKLIPVFCGILLVLGTTSVRNRIVGDSWTMITAQSGLSFFVGNNAEATGAYSNPKGIRPTHKGQDEDQKIIAENTLGRNLTSAEVSSFWRKKALTFIKENPTQYLQLLGKKFFLFFSENERTFDLDLIFQKEYKSIADFNPFYILCPLGCLGIFVARRNRRGAAYAKFLILSQLFFSLIFFLNNRHRVSILPFFICSAMFQSSLLCGWYNL